MIDQKIFEQEIANNLNLAKEIHKELSIGSTEEAYAFVITNLSLIYNNKNFNKEELKNIITDGNKDLKIDSVYIHNNFIDVFDFKNSTREKNQI